MQIIPPHDAGIAARIDQSLEVDEEAWTIVSDPWQRTEEMKARYFAMSQSLSQQPKSVPPSFLEPLPLTSVARSYNAETPLLFTYTAMHGVGLPFAVTAFEGAGFPSAKIGRAHV